MIAAVLWDLDGTLIDSEEYHWRAWQQIMAAEGRAITYDDFRATFGRRNDDFLPGWLGDRGSTAEIRRIGDAKESLYRELVREGGLEPLPGAAEWVERLHRTGWKQAIATSAPRANLECVLDVIHMLSEFEALVGAEDVTNGKPAPDVFLAAAAKAQVDASRCIVVEDADAGVEAGRRAGMRVIGISRDGHARNAHLVVGCLSELPIDAFDRLLAD